MFRLAITQRLHAEYMDFDVDYPGWLTSILDDELYYTVSVIVAGICAFGVGLCIGWICTL